VPSFADVPKFIVCCAIYTSFNTRVFMDQAAL